MENNPLYPRRHCCEISCDKPAEFEIITSRSKGGIAGPDAYSDNTDSCEEHVGRLLGHQPDAVRPEEIYWQVIPIPICEHCGSEMKGGACPRWCHNYLLDKTEVANGKA